MIHKVDVTPWNNLIKTPVSLGALNLMFDLMAVKMKQTISPKTMFKYRSCTGRVGQ